MELQDNKLEYQSMVMQIKDLATADMDEEKVMMNIDKGKYYALNSVGSRIWELMASPVTISQIISALMIEYDVELHTCRENVLEFVRRLYKEGLISIEG